MPEVELTYHEKRLIASDQTRSVAQLLRAKGHSDKTIFGILEVYRQSDECQRVKAAMMTALPRHAWRYADKKPDYDLVRCENCGMVRQLKKGDILELRGCPAGKIFDGDDACQNCNGYGWQLWTNDGLDTKSTCTVCNGTGYAK